MPSPGIPIAKVQAIRAAGRARGASAHAWLCAVGLPDDLTGVSTEHRVPAERVVELWEVLQREVRDPALPIDVAQRVRIDAYDIYGLALLTCRDVRAALGRAVRYFALAGNTGRLWVTEDGDEASVLHDRPGGAQPRLGLRCGIECVLSQVLHTLRQMVGEAALVRRVTFRHSPPADVSAHARFFGVTPRFGERENALVLDRALLSVELPRVHDSLTSFFERHAERMLASLREPTDTSVSAAVRAALAGGPFDVLPDLAAVARSLALSERTLRRRLADEGQSFKSLRDESLRERALSLLAAPRVSLVEVAFVLGFSDQTAFHRAFKRWTGKTPQSWRRDALT
jgi:AraC-like DNA-binding protein